MKLNRSKYEVVHNANVANVHFLDGSPVKKVEEAAYLGCQINEGADIRTELGKRIGKCIAILERLQVFWRHGNCPVKFKLTVFDAVIRSKLVYGLDVMRIPKQVLNGIRVVWA